MSSSFIPRLFVGTLSINDSALKAKAVSAEDRIEGGTMIVTTAAPTPVAVRYAWVDEPVDTLTNFVGLPAATFRSAP